MTAQSAAVAAIAPRSRPIGARARWSPAWRRMVNTGGGGGTSGRGARMTVTSLGVSSAAGSASGAGIGSDGGSSTPLATAALSVPRSLTRGRIAIPAAQEDTGVRAFSCARRRKPDSSEISVGDSSAQSAGAVCTRRPCALESGGSRLSRSRSSASMFCAEGRDSGRSSNMARSSSIAPACTTEKGSVSRSRETAACIRS